jgi:hypothetical protein
MQLLSCDDRPVIHSPQFLLLLLALIASLVEGGAWQFFSKAYSKGLYNEIFQSWNNECIEYKMECGGK